MDPDQINAMLLAPHQHHHHHHQQQQGAHEGEEEEEEEEEEEQGLGSDGGGSSSSDGESEGGLPLAVEGDDVAAAGVHDMGNDHDDGDDYFEMSHEEQLRQEARAKLRAKQAGVLGRLEPGVLVMAVDGPVIATCNTLGE